MRCDQISEGFGPVGTNGPSVAALRGSEPAYPAPDVIDHDRNYYSYGGPGLTKREAFAMAAMQALITAQPERIYDAISDEAILHAESLLNRLSLNQEPRT